MTVKKLKLNCSHLDHTSPTERFVPSKDVDPVEAVEARVTSDDEFAVRAPVADLPLPWSVTCSFPKIESIEKFKLIGSRSESDGHDKNCFLRTVEQFEQSAIATNTWITVHKRKNQTECNMK